MTDTEEEKRNCTHTGHYQGFGFQQIPLADGTVIGIFAVICTNCGMTFTPQNVLIDPNPPKKSIIN